VDERTELIEKVRGLVEGQRFAALATNAEGAPYANLVAVAVSDDLRQVVFSTMRATRKFANLTEDPRVAMLFDNRTNEETDLREAMAATATGNATVVDDPEREHLARFLVARHPHLSAFVSSPGCAIIRVDVDTYHAVLRFQNVYEVRMADSDRHAPQDKE
jgi:nitroimidazol reductase NimA-like FMN-containing flavoprotein (pyridoxamine 5'-phosphate oxidase superfamily)